MRKFKIVRRLAFLLVVLASHADANVVLSSTRMIFPANEQEVTIKMTNEGNVPALIQAWVDTGDPNAAPEKIDIPFMLTPSMFRMEPGKGQSLRLIYTDRVLPTDKESLFWLNVLEIPPKAVGDDRNKIQLAIRSRIKVMFRPEGLSGSADEAPGQVKWELTREGAKYAVKATNPTPYVVNLGSIELEAGEQKYDAGFGYILPGATQTFPVESLRTMPTTGIKIKFSGINDWGASKAAEKDINIK
ncbi:fimbrial biogenesis chaperone [Burkholderia ubonensis]|uniref:fimbrial biogenesis chaperone n=1 Tax=Burkholderia ubonensis TaxID=101571 RepID=UPI002ABE1AF4|nr:fimbria/pilus periplasmic chaperone [Burkholderia ubonensis]